MTRAYVLLLTVALACSHPAPPPPPIPALRLAFATDTNRAERVAPGVIRRYIQSPAGPWGIHVLDVDLRQCNRAIAVKSANSAVGREKTSVLLDGLRPANDVVGGVNADFFSLNGLQGVPSGLLVANGKVLAGPGTQPVLTFDAAGEPRALPLRVTGSMTYPGAKATIDNWNRGAAAGLAVFDRNWGTMTDTATGVIEVELEGTNPSIVVRVDTTPAGSQIRSGGMTVVAGKNASADLRAFLLTLRPGDSTRLHYSLTPFHPLQAVGGRPMLVRDSVVVPEVETEGQASFRARNPRTAVGIANRGRRLILVVVDGRQKGYSDGMTLTELASLMMSLGARDAINLDGGGSSTLVYSDSMTKAMRVANRPSDAVGERAVGDALAIVHRCK